MRSNINSLDIIILILMYISIYNIDKNAQQRQSINKLNNDIEYKLNYQNKILNEILRKVEEYGK